jgi:hypothetical protein
MPTFVLQEAMPHVCIQFWKSLKCVQCARDPPTYWSLQSTFKDIREIFWDVKIHSIWSMTRGGGQCVEKIRI